MRPCISSLRDHAAHVQICSRQICRTARLLIPTQLRINKKAPANYAGAFLFIWRRERDSNPRYAINVYTLSRRAPSATQPSLQIVVFFRRLSKLLIINQLSFGPRHMRFIQNRWVQRST